MNVVFMGSPAFAVPVLHALMSNKYDIAAVYTQPDKKGGRGQKLLACPVKEFAVSHGLTVVQPETLRNPDEIAKLKEFKPGLIIVAAYGQILPEAVLNIPQHGCLNVHPSLLPKYRGPSPVAAAILNGDTFAGVTIMLTEKKVDSGPIISQEKMVINDEDTTGTLTERLFQLGAEVLIKTLPDWIAGRIIPEKQDEKLASYTRMTVKEDGKLDWSLPAVDIWRRIRAYQPWPGCFTFYKGTRLIISKALPLEMFSDGEVGEVLKLADGGATMIVVRTGQGLLELLNVQLEGKRSMTINEFVAGHKDFIGSIL